jgi:hypothetical protein
LTKINLGIKKTLQHVKSTLICNLSLVFKPLEIAQHQWFEIAQHQTKVGNRYYLLQLHCMYGWNILHGHNNNPLWTNSLGTQGLYPSTKYFKRETLLRIELDDSQLSHFHVKWDTESDALHKICCSAIDNPKE